MRHEDKIIILDYGSQFTQLITRRVRELKVYSEILPWDTPPDDILQKQPKGLILSGGPSSVREEGAPYLDKRLLNSGIPILGVCYGMQLLVHELGGKVKKGEHAEYGRSKLENLGCGELLKGMPDTFTVWMSHWDQVTELPDGALLTAKSDVLAGFEVPERKIAGIQFHPEVVHTEGGERILSNFLFNICKCSASWNLDSWLSDQINSIREKIGNDHVICGLSGGVDSSVAAALTARATDNMDCIFVNNGLLRMNEAEQVLEAYKSMKLRVHYVDATDRFLDALKGVTEPERKRKIIGEIFIRVFEDQEKKLVNDSSEHKTWLLQGTLYPDVIESGHKGKGAAVIKSHHNVGGLPDDIKLSLLEPLRDLFKDEVRHIGRLLGVPDNIVTRQPFPGPGLAVRCLGEVSRERLAVLRHADAIFMEEIRKAGLYDKIWQAFCALLPVRSVGVIGDARMYGEVAALRAVEAQDGMTADWYHFPHELLDVTARRICNEVEAISRVVYDVTSKPPATIEWE